MPIKIYNTLAGKKEILKPPPGQPLRLFVCGPTVYDLSHIGHARTYIFFDIFTRRLKSLGRKIFYLQNITDIDDKIIRRAREKNSSPLKLSRELTHAYLKDMRALGITSVTKYAPATKFIPEIVRQVQTLIKKGFAYKIEGDGYYYDISKFHEYGKLSRRTAEQAEDAVSRIDESIHKRNRGDFCLWRQTRTNADQTLTNADKKQKLVIVNGEPSWNTSIGWGRPGWHIEDTAISLKFFGPQYELHGGGLDLKFPHHEAEIAQAEAASGKKPFVKIWMHVGMLTAAGEKMSKSLGNFITIQDFLKKHSANVLRFIVLSHHYRMPIDYTEKLAEDAKNSLASLEEFSAKLELIKKLTNLRQRRISLWLKKCEKEFAQALNDDVNTPKALSAVFSLVNDVNKMIWKLGPAQARAIEKWLKGKLEIVGIKLKNPKIPAKIRSLTAKRELLRTNQQFVRADSLRKKIEGLGYKVEDTPRGPLVLKK